MTMIHFHKKSCVKKHFFITFRDEKMFTKTTNVEVKMLKGTPPLISPELLKVLAEMGHGDEIVFADF